MVKHPLADELQEDDDAGHAYQPSGSGSSKGYNALPTYDARLDEQESLDPEANSGYYKRIAAYEFGNAGKDVQYAWSRTATRNVDALVDYLERMTDEPHELCAWSLTIEVKGEDINASSSDDRSLQVSIRLPAPLPGATLFAVHRDMPCARGGPARRLHDPHAYSRCVSRGWSYGLVREAAVLDTADQPRIASIDALMAARVRWDACLLPPWQPTESSTCSPASALQDTLRTVVTSGVQCTNLVCPRIIWGWDREALRMSLTDSIKAQLGNHLDIEITFTDARPRVLTIAGQPWLATASDASVHWLFSAASIFPVVTLVCVHEMWWALLLCLMSGLLIVLGRQYASGQDVHDGVGFAFAMNRWIPTGLPASFSREEVLADLVQRRVTHGRTPADSAEQVQLRRNADGWDVLDGTLEEWVYSRADMIVEAIRQRKAGDITKWLENKVKCGRLAKRRKQSTRDLEFGN